MICPITQTRFQFPVMNIKCKHRYERHAIIDAMKQNKSKKPTRCPKAGKVKRKRKKHVHVYWGKEL